MSTNGTKPHTELPPVQAPLMSPFPISGDLHLPQTQPQQPEAQPPTRSTTHAFTVTAAPVQPKQSNFKMPSIGLPKLNLNSDRLLLFLSKPALPILIMGVAGWAIDLMGFGAGYRLFTPMIICVAMVMRDIGDGDNRLRGEKLVFFGLRFETWFFLGFGTWIYFIPWAQTVVGQFLQSLR